MVCATAGYHVEFLILVPFTWFVAIHVPAEVVGRR